MTNIEDADTPSEIPDSSIEAALRGHRSAGEHPGLDRVADAMNTLRRPGVEAEQQGQDLAMAAYRERFCAARPAAVGPRRVALVSSVAGLKLLGTAAGSAVALGAVATVLFATSLGPAAPDTLPVGTGSTTAAGAKADATKDGGVGPDARGPASFGLCNAWSHHETKGTGATKDADETDEDNSDEGSFKDSTAFRNLAAAAGGEARIAAYCAKVPRPGRGHGTGKPAKTKPAKTKPASTKSHPAKPTKTPQSTKSPSPRSTTTARPSITVPGPTGLPTPTTTTTATTTATTQG